MRPNTTRAEHLAWAKQRALEYVKLGELSNAVASMTSDLGEHPDFATPGTLMAIGLGLLEIGRGPEAVRHWIEGFN